MHYKAIIQGFECFCFGYEVVFVGGTDLQKDHSAGRNT